MMTHDPFLNYQALGAYPGAATPFGLPYTAYQPPFNPLAIAGSPQTHPGIGGYGIYNPLQGVGPWQQPAGLNPFATGLQNPILQQLQNPILQHLQAQSHWQNPLLLQAGVFGGGLQNPQLGYPQNPQLGYHNWLQQPQQFNYPLAPQTFAGAGGIGQTPGQIHPLAQLAMRQYGIGPQTGCF